jgi:hypothetical protein
MIGFALSLLAEPPISAPSFLHRAIGAKRQQARDD